jgi:hypothetical protein
MGQALYPHRQWQALAKLWESFYPATGLDEERQWLLAALEVSIPAFVALLVNHRPRALRGKSLLEVMSVAECHPARLAAYYQAWRASPAQMRAASPSLVFAVIGQARADGKMSPEEESTILADLLAYWALRSTLDSYESCARRPMARAAALVT